MASIVSNVGTEAHWTTRAMKPMKQKKNFTGRGPGMDAMNSASITPYSIDKRSMPSTSRIVGMSMPLSRYVKVMNGAQALKISIPSTTAAKNLPHTIDTGRNVEMNS